MRVNCDEQNLPWEANSRSAVQKNSTFLGGNRVPITIFTMDPQGSLFCATRTQFTSSYSISLINGSILIYKLITPCFPFFFPRFYSNYKTKNFHQIWCDFARASSLICGNKMPTRCNRGFYCRSYCLLNMFRAPLCPSAEGYVSGLQDTAASCKPDT